MRMMVFDHRACRWVPWHGSRIAWLKLPHAVAASVCALSATALLALTTPSLLTLSSRSPADPAPPPAVTSPAPANAHPEELFLPASPSSTTESPEFSSSDLLLAQVPSLPPTSGNPPAPTDPEPGSILLVPNLPVVTHQGGTTTHGGNSGGGQPPNLPATVDPADPPPTQVPEPGTLALLGAAVLLLAAERRVACHVQSGARRSGKAKNRPPGDS